MMSNTRAINVLTLSAILFLAGCFGFGDSVEADDDDDEMTITTSDLTEAMLLASNSPPDLSIKKFDYQTEDLEGVMRSNWEYSGYFACVTADELADEDIGATLQEQRNWFDDNYEGEISSIHLANLIVADSCVVYFDFLSVDPDGDAITKGIDVDFDGSIDIPITTSHGVTMAVVDQSLITSIWNGLSVFTESCEQIDLAFIAVDEHGASTSEFMHFIGMSSCESDDDDDSDDGGSLYMYQFSSRDAAGTMSSGGGDDLVHIQMTQGDDLSWALLKVSIVVDGGASQQCVEAGAADGTEGCTWAMDGDNSWSVSEEISISEGANNNLCDGSQGGCDVDVTITKIGVGNQPDKVLAQVMGYADANN